MPYADPEKQREANRDSMRRARERKRREGWQKVSLPPKLVHKLDALREADREMMRRERAEGEPDPPLASRREWIAEMCENAGWILDAQKSGLTFDEWNAQEMKEVCKGLKCPNRRTGVVRED